MSTAAFPTYITELVQKALGKAFSLKNCSDEISKLTAVQVKLASENGENFCSTIYRVYAKYGSLEKHFVVKDMLSTDTDSNERMMYESVLPQMEKLLSEKLGPTCFHVMTAPKEVFVLEDLNVIGYSIADRQLGLDAEHTKVLLQKIAKFHAVSMVYMEQFPNEAARITSQAEDSQNDSDDDDTDDMWLGIVNKGIESAAKVVEKWENYTTIAQKMRKSIVEFDDRMKVLLDPVKAGIRVIKHGDPWVNNFLYRYENNKPVDAVFVDFQNSCIGSPATDLNYFLYTSVQLPLLKIMLNDFLQIYYDTFCATLRHFNYANIPSFEELQSEMRRCAFFGYYAAVCELPICCMSKEASFGFTQATFKDPEKLAKKHLLMFDNCERVLETLRYALIYFNDLGILD